ncbi:MAG: hypothetical protein I8H91_02420 [Burkholderiales bacterium]|nr:hypothetical protein [Burkholderiales bacterium]
MPWTHNLIILNQSKRPEEREFYLRQAIREQWSKRELKCQFKTALFECTVLRPCGPSTAGHRKMSCAPRRGGPCKAASAARYAATSHR